MQRFSALMAYEAHLRNSSKPDLGSSCLTDNMNVYNVTHYSASRATMKQTTSTTKNKEKKNQCVFSAIISKDRK